MIKEKKFKIVILSDSKSWMNSTIKLMMSHWKEAGHNILWSHCLQNITAADFCFCLSFSNLVPFKIRRQFKHTLVVHESDLPAGKGWSPLSWQILEGKSRIPITLFEAAEQIDSGQIYAQYWVDLEGHELIDELRAKQASATREICQWFIDHYPESLSGARAQKGKESFYMRRDSEDSKLDPYKTIAEQFNLLRVVDNDRYPAFFQLNGKKFYLTIVKDESLQ